MTGSLLVRDATPGDAGAIATIYNAHVRDTIATFELQQVAPDAMAQRIASVQSAGLPWLVAEAAGTVHAYAYAAPWKPRAAYARTAETSIYVADAAVGQGIGKRLYAALLERARQAGMHALIGGISLPNSHSVALHEALGFVQVAHFRETGHKFGCWIDVGYWQLLLRDDA